MDHNGPQAFVKSSLNIFTGMQTSNDLTRYFFEHLHSTNLIGQKKFPEIQMQFQKVLGSIVLTGLALIFDKN